MSVIFILFNRKWHDLFGTTKDRWSVVMIEISKPPWARRREGGTRSGGSDAVQVRLGEGIPGMAGSEAAEGDQARP